MLYRAWRIISNPNLKEVTCTAEEKLNERYLVMKIIDRTAVETAASVAEWTEAMEQAILKSLNGDVLMPPRSHIDKGDDSFLIMPCIDERYWSTKLVSFCPGNREKDLPSIFGTVVLNSSKTGEPLAIIEGTALTAYRTA